MNIAARRNVLFHARFARLQSEMAVTTAVSIKIGGTYPRFDTGKRFCVPRSGAQISRFGFVRTMFGKAASFETVVSNEMG